MPKTKVAPPSKVKVNTRSRRVPLAEIPILNPVITITTASDGPWPLTQADLDFLTAPTTTPRPAFEVCSDHALSRPLPTSVVYRVWGMMERGELHEEKRRWTAS